MNPTSVMVIEKDCINSVNLSSGKIVSRALPTCAMGNENGSLNSLLWCAGYLALVVAVPVSAKLIGIRALNQAAGPGRARRDAANARGYGQVGEGADR